jgi:hypothetical protein
MGRLVRFTSPNRNKRIFLYGSLFSPGGPWSVNENQEEEYDERIIVHDTLGIIVREHMCKRFNTTFYGILTMKGDMGWVHCKNVEFLV